MKRIPNKALRKLREELELSQSKLAVILNVGQPSIQHWEAGERRLPIKMAKRLIVLVKNKYTLEDLYHAE